MSPNEPRACGILMQELLWWKLKKRETIKLPAFLFVPFQVMCETCYLGKEPGIHLHTYLVIKKVPFTFWYGCLGTVQNDLLKKNRQTVSWTANKRSQSLPPSERTWRLPLCPGGADTWLYLRPAPAKALNALFLRGISLRWSLGLKEGQIQNGRKY